MPETPLIITIASTVAAMPAVQAKIEERLHAYGRMARGAFSPNTARAIEGDMAGFVAFCATVPASPTPAEPATVIAYLEDCVRRGHRIATVRRRLSSIAHIHRAADQPDPTKSIEVKLAMRRLARELPGRQRQAQGLTEIDAARIIGAIGPSPSTKDVRDLALLCVGRYLLARRSELVALDIEDIEFRPDGTALALIRRSKTDPEGKGTVTLIGRQGTAWLKRWLAAAQITGGAVFRTLTKGGRPRGRLRAADVPAIFKALAARAGIDPALISGHSVRVGMAQDLVAGGYDLGGIMQAGRWKSATMVARYSERLMPDRGVLAQYDSRRGS
jgi:site-specific recombinase XerD